MVKSRQSEVRSYGFILDSLEEMGWSTRPPTHGGDVYTQHEVRRNNQLKASLSSKVPENVVRIDHDQYWTIEAKSDLGDIDTAVKEARQYADLINDGGGG